MCWCLGMIVWWQTRHFNFDAQGRPVVYLSFRRDGVYKSYAPGIDRVTGRPKYQITLDRVAWLSNLARQPVREVDPAVDSNWFDPNSGEPNLWYVETGTNQWQFFNRPMFHPQLGVEARPITPALMKCWQAEHNRQVAAAEALRRQQEAEARAAAEKTERQEREQAEQKRQTDLRIRAEAEAVAKLEASRRAQEEQLAAAQKNSLTNTDGHKLSSLGAEARQRGTAASLPLPKSVEHKRRRVWRTTTAPVVKVVELPFVVVGSIFKGLVGSVCASHERIITVDAPTPPVVYTFPPPPPPIHTYYSTPRICTVSRPSTGHYYSPVIRSPTVPAWSHPPRVDYVRQSINWAPPARPIAVGPVWHVRNIQCARRNPR
jgi:hypothetical protein